MMLKDRIKQAVNTQLGVHLILTTLHVLFFLLMGAGACTWHVALSAC